jgi:hypothetical protein
VPGNGREGFVSQSYSFPGSIAHPGVPRSAAHNLHASSRAEGPTVRLRLSPSSRAARLTASTGASGRSHYAKAPHSRVVHGRLEVVPRADLWTCGGYGAAGGGIDCRVQTACAAPRGSTRSTRPPWASALLTTGARVPSAAHFPAEYLEQARHEGLACMICTHTHSTSVALCMQ